MANKKPIDKDLFEMLLDAGKSKSEICSILNTSDKTLSVWVYSTYGKKFTEISKAGSGGRPNVVIDKAQFETMCFINCTEEEIMLVLRVDNETLNSWCKRTYSSSFSQVYRIYANKGKQSLRRYQMKLAETNPQMAIWLGKQYLGQRDVVEQDIRATVNETQQQLIDKLAGRINLEEEESPTDEQSEDN